MKDIAERLGPIAGGLALLALLGSVIYIWMLGGELAERAEREGWLTPAPDRAPLTRFEETMAKAIFHSTFGDTGFPCRSISLNTAGRFKDEKRASYPVSMRLIRDMEIAGEPGGSLPNSFKMVAGACRLEMGYNDTQLLRLWLRRARLGEYVGAEAASQRYFDKAPDALTETEAFKLAALDYGPDLWRDPAAWDSFGEELDIATRRLVWHGDQLLAPRREATP